MLLAEKDLIYNFEKQLEKAKKGQPYSAAYVADCYLRGWGTGKDYDLYLKYLEMAAELGDRRSCMQMFFLNLKNGNLEFAVSWLSYYKKISNQHSYYVDKINRVLEQSDHPMTAEEVFASFDENEDEYIMALCLLFGYGCRIDPVKASNCLVKLVKTQIENNGAFGTLALFYPVQVLLWHCYMLLSLIGNEDLKSTVEYYLGEVACSGDYSMAKDDDITGNPNERAGFFELSLIHFSHISKYRMPKFKRELCIMYCCDLSSDGKKEYPTWRGIFSETSALVNDKEDVEPILLMCGLYADNGTRIRAGSTLIEYGSLAAGYYVLAGVYDEMRDYRKALRYLYMWADLKDKLDNYPIASAQYWIGKYFHDGKGVERDIDSCFEWWIRAAGNGDERAKEMVDLAREIGHGNLEAGIQSIKYAGD